MSGSYPLLARALLTPLVAAAITLELGGMSEAAMALRITVDPSSPGVGRPARVTVVTLAPFNSLCVDDPNADMRPWSDWHTSAGELRFELKAFQGDRVIDIPLRRRETDRPYWDGQVIFPRGGPWTVRMVYPEWGGGTPHGEECAGARITVLVQELALPATGTDDQANATTGKLRPASRLLFVGLALLGSVALLRLRSRQRT